MENNEGEKLFYALSPCDDKVNDNYKAALDYALADNDICNIGLTGPYGCGKSSLWRGYCKPKNISHINVSLGDYVYVNNEEENSNKSTSKSTNSVERQLINQIAAQIPREKIPLSNYSWKENKTSSEVLNILFPILVIIISLGLIFMTNEFNWMKNTGCFFFIVSLGYVLFRYLSTNNLDIKKLQIHGSGAEFSKEDNQSVFDKDIREIIYLISNLKEDIIVFEDLDRLEDKSILVKLRDLNFIINSYNRTKGNNIKKFIYMIDDTIFIEKDRVKFFDFIIPVIPIVNSVNSEAQLYNKLGPVYNKDLNLEMIRKISYFIDDMRLLNNIVNEYKLYFGILNIDKLNLNANKFFALVVFKNICPKDFIDLHNKQGELYKLLSSKKELVDLLNEDIIYEINSLSEKSGTTVRARTTDEHIREEDKPKQIELILKKQNNENLSFSELIEKVKDKRDVLNSIYQEDQRKQAIISFFIMNDFLDERYNNYIGYFYQGILSINDMNYLLSLDSMRYLVNPTPLDNPENVYMRLDSKDFVKMGILHHDIILCISSHQDFSKLKFILNSTFSNSSEKEYFIRVLETFDPDNFTKIGKMIRKINEKYMKDIIETMIKEDEAKNIDKIQKYVEHRVSSIMDYDSLNLWRDIVEKYKDKWITMWLDNPENFFHNLNNMCVKINNLKSIPPSSWHRTIPVLIKTKVYEKDFKDIFHVISMMYFNECSYSNLWSTISNNEKLSVMKEYIEEDLEKFLEDYINYPMEPKEFRNSKEDTLQILNSRISEQTKEIYKKYNKTIIEGI